MATAKHKWLKERKIVGAWIVLRIDDYTKEQHAARGQFYHSNREDDRMKAIWPTELQAVNAAKWAAEQFGRQYGVFKMNSIIEPMKLPIKQTKVV